MCERSSRRHVEEHALDLALAERMLQRSAAQRGVEQNSVEASSEGKIEIRNENTVKNSSGEVIVMGRNSEIAVLDAKDKEKAVYRIPYGSRLLVKDGQKIKPGEKMADWER